METVTNTDGLAGEVARLREQVLDLGAEVVTLTKELAEYREGLRRAGKAAGLELLPAREMHPSRPHLVSLPGGAS